jgi:predicted nucleotidyltransferase
MRGLSEIKLKPNERKAINAFSRRLKKALGKQLVSVLLFGSKARGESHKESDIDIFVLVKRATLQVDDKVAGITADIWEQYDVILSPVIYSVYERERNLQMHSFFFEAVQAEGVPL